MRRKLLRRDSNLRDGRTIPQYSGAFTVVSIAAYVARVRGVGKLSVNSESIRIESLGGMEIVCT